MQILDLLYDLPVLQDADAELQSDLLSLVNPDVKISKIQSIVVHARIQNIVTRRSARAVLISPLIRLGPVQNMGFLGVVGTKGTGIEIETLHNPNYYPHNHCPQILFYTEGYIRDPHEITPVFAIREIWAEVTQKDQTLTIIESKQYANTRPTL